MDSIEKLPIQPDFEPNQSHDDEDYSTLEGVINGVGDDRRAYWEHTLKYYLPEQGNLPLDYSNVLMYPRSLKDIDEMRRASMSDPEQESVDAMWQTASKDLPTYEEYIRSKSEEHGDRLADDIANPDVAKELANRFYRVVMDLPVVISRQPDLNRRINVINYKLAEVRSQDSVSDEDAEFLRRETNEVQAVLEGKGRKNT